MLVVVNKRDSRISDSGKRIFPVMTRPTVGLWELMKGRWSLVISQLAEVPASMGHACGCGCPGAMENSECEPGTDFQ